MKRSGWNWVGFDHWLCTACRGDRHPQEYGLGCRRDTTLGDTPGQALGTDTGTPGTHGKHNVWYAQGIGQVFSSLACHSPCQLLCFHRTAWPTRTHIQLSTHLYVAHYHGASWNRVPSQHIVLLEAAGHHRHHAVAAQHLLQHCNAEAAAEAGKGAQGLGQGCARVWDKAEAGEVQARVRMGWVPGGTGWHLLP